MSKEKRKCNKRKKKTTTNNQELTHNLCIDLLGYYREYRISLRTTPGVKENVPTCEMKKDADRSGTFDIDTALTFRHIFAVSFTQMINV